MYRPKDSINRMCHREQQILVYIEDIRNQLKWNKCNRIIGNNQLYGPWSIATNPMYGIIYSAPYVLALRGWRALCIRQRHPLGA